MGGSGQEDELKRWDGEVVWERIWGFLEGISVGSHSCVSVCVLLWARLLGQVLSQLTSLSSLTLAAV